MATVLIVDDEAPVREVFSAFLALDGHAVLLAEDVAEALALLEETPVDLVLSDLRLPEESGIDLAFAVAERWPEVRVVIVTGHPTRDTVDAARSAGAVGYLSKPIRGARLRTAVAEALALTGPGWVGD